MANLTEKNMKEFLVDVATLKTMKVVEETVTVKKPVFEEVAVEVPVFKDVPVDRPIFKEKEITAYVLKEKSLANAMKPVIAEIQRLERDRADLAAIVARAIDESVERAFLVLLKKLSK